MENATLVKGFRKSFRDTEILNGEDNINYRLPGILFMAVASGTACTAFRLFLDVQRGLFSRFNSVPVGIDIRIALAWYLGIFVVSYLFAMRIYKRTSA